MYLVARIGMDALSIRQLVKQFAEILSTMLPLRRNLVNLTPWRLAQGPALAWARLGPRRGLGPGRLGFGPGWAQARLGPGPSSGPGPARVVPWKHRGGEARGDPGGPSSLAVRRPRPRPPGHSSAAWRPRAPAPQGQESRPRWCLNHFRSIFGQGRCRRTGPGGIFETPLNKRWSWGPFAVHA